MQATNLTLQMTRYKNRKLYIHVNNAHVGYVNLSELSDYIREGAEITSYKEHGTKHNYPLSNVLVNAIHDKEPTVGDTALLNRIIRGGGLTAYTKLLEFSSKGTKQ